MSKLPKDHTNCPVCNEKKNIFFPGGPMAANKPITELDAKCYNCQWVGKVIDLVAPDRVVYNIEDTDKGQRCVCRQI